MGEVFEAEDPLLRRRVAVKVMRPHLAADPVARQRFLHEAQALAALEHERIVPIHRVGEVEEPHGPAPYLVMPLLRGESLRQRLKRTPRLSLAEVRRIGLQVAEGLAAAHAVGLIHRDVKPDNIWLKETDDGEASVLLLDFGLARGVTSDVQLSEPGEVMGTPAYLAPEQAAGEPVDARTDLFALGCVLYEMTTGRRPFQGTTVPGVLSQIVNHDPPPPHEVDPSVPPTWSRLVMRLLEKNPEARPASAGEVIAALHASEGGGTFPGAVGSPRSGAQPSRRALVLLLAGVAAMTVAGVAVALFRPPFGSGEGATTPPGGVTPPALGAMKGDLDVLIWEKNNKRRQNLRLGDAGTLPVKAGDHFAVLAEMERPAYLYVVWIGADGVVEPVYPWLRGDWSQWPAEESPTTTVRCPQPADEFFTLPATPGMETMVLFARETPLPRDVDLKAELGTFRPQTAEDITAVAWFENGKVADDPSRKRASKLGVTRADDPVLTVQRRVTEVAERLGCRYTRAVSFANQGK